ncbi:ArsR/SmtB family transcription factor [Nocardiopsis ganjiahuensis]|uniref:ArsR/SmtB family transcription factor n=1 Tax=Nocardiopsis ganjiahuensis TaxID=239984 RepID=UPI0003497440|nr:helix-turn-helix domain-containing protein [Nocardiopsis ganjiahuensis]
MSRILLDGRGTARVRVRAELPAQAQAAQALGPLLRPVPPRDGAEWVRLSLTRLARTRLTRRELAEARALFGPDLPRAPRTGATPAGLRRVLRTLEAVSEAAVEPYRKQIEARQHRAAHLLGLRVGSLGVAAALDSLSSRCRWEDDVLFVDDGLEREYETGGEGLLLLPSVFTGPEPHVARWNGAEGRRTVLLFPALGPCDALDSLLERSRSRENLERLIGRTRTAVLAALVVPASTGQLAKDLYVSPTSVSEHTAALRQAGLITTTREGNRVRHLATAFGLALLEHADARERAVALVESA